ncbi:MAG: hypothetical protein WBG37_15200 [Desulfobacterales bacterium]|jgi:hypothetical protein
MGAASVKFRVGLPWALAGLLALLLLGDGLRAASANPQVSLDVAESTLGEALEKLSSQTGYAFDLDPQWADQRVTLKVRDISLRECLQRLLVRFNYAIVFEGDEQIALNIFGEQTVVRGGPLPQPPYPRASARVPRPSVPLEEEQLLEDEIDEDIEEPGQEDEASDEEIEAIEEAEAAEIEEETEERLEDAADEGGDSDQETDAQADEGEQESGGTAPADEGVPDAPEVQVSE